MRDQTELTETGPARGAGGSAPSPVPGGAVPSTASTVHALSGAAAHATPGVGVPRATLAADAAPGGASLDAVGGPTAEQVRLALRRVKDPELNLNIIDLGLVYDVRVAGSVAEVDMSLTSPGCPSGAELTAGAEQAARSVPGIDDAIVTIIWEPMWTPARIEPRVRAYLGF